MSTYNKEYSLKKTSLEKSQNKWNAAGFNDQNNNKKSK